MANVAALSAHHDIGTSQSSAQQQPHGERLRIQQQQDAKRADRRRIRCQPEHLGLGPRSAAARREQRVAEQPPQDERDAHALARGALLAEHVAAQRQRQQRNALQRESDREAARGPVDRRVAQLQEEPGHDPPAHGEEQRGAAQREGRAFAPHGGGAMRARPAAHRRAAVARATTLRSGTRTAASRCAARTSGSRTADTSTTRSPRAHRLTVRITARQPRGHAARAAPRRACGRARRPCSGARARRWLVAGIAQVTAGCETMNFSATCAQLSQSISAAQAGRRWRASCRSSAPSRNGRLTMTAMPRSCASGRMRCSTSRSSRL